MNSFSKVLYYFYAHFSSGEQEGQECLNNGILGEAAEIVPEKEQNESKKSIETENNEGETEVLSNIEQIAKLYYQEEKERVKTIEGKASMFITSSNFLGTILLGTSNILLARKDDPMLIRVLMICCLFIIATCMFITVFYAIKALKRENYYRIDPISLTTIKTKDEYQKQVIADLINSTKLNQGIANKKSDAVDVAQKSFKCLLFFVLAFILILLFRVFLQSDISIRPCLCTHTNLTLSIKLWQVIVASLLILSSFVISIISLVKGKKKKG